MPTCRACGAQAPDDARFCPTCGTYFAPAAPPAPPVPGVPDVPAAAAGRGPRPVGVTIMAIWNLLAGPLFAIVGLFLVVMGPAVFADPSVQREMERQGLPITQAMLAGAVAALGMFLVVIGAAMAVVGYGLYRGEGWSWTGMIAMSIVWAILGALALLGGGVLPLAIAVFLLWYFTRPGVRVWFGKAPPPQPGLPSYVPPPPPAGP